MARPFVEELPTQDAWAVVRDALDGSISDWDLTLRTVNDCMSYASWAALNHVFQGVSSNPADVEASAKATIDQLAARGVQNVGTLDWKTILKLIDKVLHLFIDS